MEDQERNERLRETSALACLVHGLFLYADVIFWLNKISGIFSPFLLRFGTMDNLVSV